MQAGREIFEVRGFPEAVLDIVRAFAERLRIIKALEEPELLVVWISAGIFLPMFDRMRAVRGLDRRIAVDIAASEGLRVPPDLKDELVRRFISLSGPADEVRA